MRPTALFAIATLIWGSTWLAITFQLGIVAPEASVAYRFALAALLLATWCMTTGRSLRFPLRQHLWFVVQGVLLFGLNYLFVYRAELSIASGLVALVFSLVVFLNLVGVRIFFAIPINRRILAGAILGVSGVSLLFWHELGDGHGDTLRGIAFATGGTVFAAGGNLIAVRNQRRGVALLPGVAWGMAYGALAIALVAVTESVTWTFDIRLPYIASLLYLAAFGSVIAFSCYLTLLGRIGAARAGYVGVAVPVVALILSTVFEHYQWTLLSLCGAALCVIGNVLVLMPRPTAKRADAMT